jgi:endonuclease YncB( thermonuclease family)
MLEWVTHFLWGWAGVAILVTLLFLIMLRGGRGRTFDGHDPYVIDGDTLVSDRVRIRLAAMDAPEMSQPGGAEARSHLIRLIAGGSVRIEPTGKDKYGRVVARVYVRAGDLGQLMVRDGYARAAYGRDYAAEERAARGSRAGLWAGPGIPSPAAHRARSADSVKNRRVSRWT